MSRQFPAPKQSAFEQAVALANAGRIAESVPLFARAVKAHPKDAVLRFNLANALRLSGAGKAAAQEYEACLKLDSGVLDARMNLALLYNELGRPDKAVDHAKAILARSPLHAGAIVALCVAARQTQKIQELLPFLDRIIEPLLASPPPPAGIARDRHHFAVAGVCELLERIPEAVAHFLQAKSLPTALSMGLRLKSAICDWSDFDRLKTELETQAAENPGHISPLPFITLSDDPALQLKMATATATRLAHCAQLPPQPQNSGQRLRIGYLSADFRSHPVAFLIADTIAHHDRDRFDVVLYSNGPDDGSVWRKRFAEMGKFTDLRPFSDLEAAQLIARDRIDVLVDLSGHTSMNRLPILAYHPAKVVMNWLGYPGTLGLNAVDYIIADHTLIRPEDERYYTETVIRVPVTYQPSSRDRAPAEDETVERPHGGIVLSAFNQPFKIIPEIFSIWCRLLLHRDDAVLWLYASNETAQANLRKEAANRGVDPSRLIFAEAIPLARHLARYRHVDLQLDSFPYGGHTTTSDALLMGCPVLALSGNSFPSRVAGSLLAATGLDDFICHSAAEYERKAIECLDNPAVLADARVRIQSGNSVLFQPERFCRELEFAYEAAVARRDAGMKPIPIDVPLRA